MKQLGILEGILFVMGDEGIDLKSLCEIMGINETEAKDLLMQLKKSYEDDSRGLRISYLGRSKNIRNTMKSWWLIQVPIN